MGRTKGSKNGISTTPGYVAIGQRAQNDWQQQAARARGMVQQVNPYAAANSQLSANLQAQRRQALLNRSAKQIQQTATDAKDRQREAAQAYAKLILQRIQDQKAAKEAAKRAKKDKHKASQAGGTNDWQRTANATAAGVSVEREPYTDKVKTHEEYAKARIKARKKALRARKARKKK
jgi:hypothetical protein